MADIEPADAADVELLYHLRQVRELRQRHGNPKPPVFQYTGIEDFLIQHGTFFKPTALPPTVRPMRVSRCFDNAYRVASRTKAYHYVEGYAMGLLPLLHAWLVDREGHVIDPTWASSRTSLGTSYFGVELNLDEVKRSRRLGSGTVLEDFKRDFPALQGVEVIAPDAWFTQQTYK